MSKGIEHQIAPDPALVRRLERLGLAGHEEEWTDRYLLCNHLLNPPTAQPRQKFEATSRFIRDLIAHRWAKTRRSREQANPKRIHYFSMEFLLGRALRNNMINLSAEPIVRRAMEQEGWNYAASGCCRDHPATQLLPDKSKFCSRRGPQDNRARL